MRVFKTYLYNLADYCRFNRTYVELESFLEANCLNYSDSIFICEELDYNKEKRITDKIIDKLPQAKKYLKHQNKNGFDTNVISNCQDNWKPINNTNSIELARLLSTKIPRPYNLTDAYFVLNNISFFDHYTDQAIKHDANYLFDTPLSSNILFERHFNSGTKYNYVCVTIEVTSDQSGKAILDDSKYVSAFEKYFDVECININMTAVVDELLPGKSERKEIEEIVSKVKESLESWEGADMKLVRNPADDFRQNQYSFKKSISKFNKKNKKGYIYYKYDNFTYYLRKIDQTNHAIELGITTAPKCRRIDTFISYRGLAFEYKFKMPSFTPLDQSEADLYMEMLMQVMDNVEQKYFSQIAKYYTATPQWFIY